MNVSVSYRSQMNPDVVLNEDTWAVSLVVEKPGYHTLLIIEKVQQAARETLKAHLTGPGSRTTPLKDLGSPWYCWSKNGVVHMDQIVKVLHTDRYRKWDTWSVKRAVVEQLIRDIEKDKKNPEKIPFSIFGGKSLFSSEVGFVIEGDTELEIMRKQEPEKFEELFALYEENKKMEHALETCEAKGEPLKESHALATKYQCLRAFNEIANRATKRLDDADNEGVVVKIAAIGYSLQVLPVALAAIVIDLPRVRYYQKKAEENRNLLTRIEAHVQKVIAQNCFNWARNKLTAVGIELPELSCERIAVIPTLYLKGQKKQ